MKYEPIPAHLMGEELVGRKVVRTNDIKEEPAPGKVVSVNATLSRIWVLWPGDTDPRSHRHPELKLVPHDPFAKRFKWAGKTFGELKAFVEQAEAEGVTDDTTLNDSNAMYVHVEVSLPLAPVEAPKHDHEFTEPCPVKCPAFMSGGRR